ncbi:ribonuclease H [Elysia marginata]|uniref:Ribonuclease H n=1 Tax=Elysia marginata TaxID=1093978 RepID=A0AAV4EIK2_9GAST|nr:ribonuclease H [Elysia marginata]
MAGDVKRNAGPSDLCSVCGKIVAAGRVVPQCSSCLHWVHARCSDLTYQRIRRLQPDHNWSCPPCTPRNQCPLPRSQSPPTPPTSMTPTPTPTVPQAPTPTTNPKKGFLKLAQWNCPGLNQAKKTELNWFLSNEKIDVVFIQETNLNNDTKCNIPGYLVIKTERTTARNIRGEILGGGILTAISPGDDEVHNQLLQHLPEIGKQSLLQLYNRVKNSGQYPAAWRKGTIIPILKTGKDPSQMGSYRPIQLTSCVGKLYERLLKTRLNHLLEEEKLLNPRQAGFRCLRNTEDQVTRVTQTIVDGLNNSGPQKREGIEISLFADDLALLVQHENLDEAASLLQQGLQCVEDWSLQWKMTLIVEKCDDPLREIAENPVRRRLKSLGTWRETGKSSAEDSGPEDLPRERLIPVPDIPPWMIPDTFSCSPSLMTSVSKTDPPEAQKAAVEETMKYLAKPDIEIYTDGSAMDGIDYLDGGISIRYPNGEKESMSIAAGRHGSSFRAEAMALTTALRWLDVGEKCGNLLILTDSQALVRKLERGAEKSISELQKETWRLIYRVARRDNTRLHIQWIPGHCGVEGNEEADRLANQGQMLDQFDTAIDFASAKNVVRKHVLKTVWAPQNVHESQPTGIRPPPRRDKESGLTGRERVVLAQLHCNEKSPILQQYLYSSCAADSEACLTCGASPDNLDHVLKECPTGAPYRDSLPENPRDALWTDPVRVVELLRACDRIPVTPIV